MEEAETPPPTPMENEPLDETNKSRKRNQVFGAAVAMLGGFSLGLAIGWSSPAEEVLKHINATTTDANEKKEVLNSLGKMFWIASVMPLGAMCVMFPLSYFVETVGRKMTMLCVAPLVSVSFIIVGVSLNFYALLVGRFLMGFSAAAFCVAAPIYVGEIAEKGIRGALGVFFQLLLVIGIALQYSLGMIKNMIVLGIVSAVFPVIFVLIFIFLPESPIFLVMKNKQETAMKSLQWYRGKNYNINPELEEIENHVEEIRNKKVSYKDLFSSGPTRKSVFMALGLMIFQQLSGINVIMFYATDLFNDAGSSLKPLESSVLLAVVQIVFTVVSSLVIDKAGRKMLLYISHIGMAVCLCAQGGWFIYIDKETPSEALQVLPIIILCLYLVFFSLGSGPIPWTMIGEIFPPEVKGLCGSIASFVNWAFAFIVTITFKYFKDDTPSYVPYFVYAALCVFGAVFFFVFLIETKNKTLDEIQKELQS